MVSRTEQTWVYLDKPVPNSETTSRDKVGHCIIVYNPSCGLTIINTHVFIIQYQHMETLTEWKGGINNIIRRTEAGRTQLQSQYLRSRDRRIMSSRIALAT